jgi:hypothetical protein
MKIGNRWLGEIVESQECAAGQPVYGHSPWLTLVVLYSTLLSQERGTGQLLWCQQQPGQCSGV